MRISDWSSDVCSSDLRAVRRVPELADARLARTARHRRRDDRRTGGDARRAVRRHAARDQRLAAARCGRLAAATRYAARSEEHTSELQSLMRISYAVFCLKKKNME